MTRGLTGSVLSELTCIFTCIAVLVDFLIVICLISYSFIFATSSIVNLQLLHCRNAIPKNYSNSHVICMTPPHHTINLTLIVKTKWLLKGLYSK